MSGFYVLVLSHLALLVLKTHSYKISKFTIKNYKVCSCTQDIQETTTVDTLESAGIKICLFFEILFLSSDITKHIFIREKNLMKINKFTDMSPEKVIIHQNKMAASSMSRDLAEMSHRHTDIQTYIHTYIHTYE